MCKRLATHHISTDSLTQSSIKREQWIHQRFADLEIYNFRKNISVISLWPFQLAEEVEVPGINYTDLSRCHYPGFQVSGRI